MDNTEETLTVSRSAMADKHSAWIEIHTRRLRHNVQVLRDHIGYPHPMIAVIKANAYGHGAVRIAETLSEEGFETFAVATIEEAVDLRKSGINEQILVMNSVDMNQAYLFVEYEIIPSIHQVSFAVHMQNLAKKQQQTIPVHIRVDLANGTPGAPPDQANHLIDQVLRLDNLRIAGVYTHLVSAYTQEDHFVQEDQYVFDRIVDHMKRLNEQQVVIHAASSPALIQYPLTYYDCVRPGTCLYGLPSLPNQTLPLQQVMELKTKIVEIKRLNAGVSRGYDYHIKQPERTLIAKVPIGYSSASYLYHQRDGQALIRGEKVDIYGHAFMSHLMIDISGIPEAELGDEVVLFGQQGEQIISVADIAQASGIGLTNCELICLIDQTIPRIYI